jgi:hypothetical protein
MGQQDEPQSRVNYFESAVDLLSRYRTYTEQVIDGATAAEEAMEREGEDCPPTRL